MKKLKVNILNIFAAFNINTFCVKGINDAISGMKLGYLVLANLIYDITAYIMCKYKCLEISIIFVFLFQVSAQALLRLKIMDK